MFDIVIEIIRAVIVGVIVSYLLITGKEEEIHKQRISKKDC